MIGVHPCRKFQIQSPTAYFQPGDSEVGELTNFLNFWGVSLSVRIGSGISVSLGFFCIFSLRLHLTIEIDWEMDGHTTKPIITQK